MKKTWKIIAITLGSLVGLVLIVALALFFGANSRFNRAHDDIVPEKITVPDDPDSLAIGAHWVDVQCRDCHADDLGGGPFFDDPALGTVDAPNLTSGEGGVGSAYTDGDWVRALRHGIRLDGKSVFIMPSNDFYYFSDADLGSIIAYLKTVPPVDRQTRPRSLTPMAKIMYTLGAFGDLLYAETIQHDIRPEAPPVGMTLEYGEYLVNVNGCPTCHGSELSGKQPSEPGAPLAPNLTPGGRLAVWTEAEFIRTLRTRITPYNYELSDSMPAAPGKLSDTELQTIWMYLQSLPARETTTE